MNEKKMTYSRAIQIIQDIDKLDPVEDAVMIRETIAKILSMTTINAVKKDYLLNVVRFLFNEFYEWEDPAPTSTTEETRHGRLIDADRMLSELKPITHDMEQNAVTIADMSNIMRNWVMRQPTISSTQWTRVEDDMPPEHDSIFRKFEGTSKWLAGMYETISDDVNAVVKFEDGTRKVYTLHTTDGKWRNLPIAGNPIVTHWAPLPSLPEEE